MATRLTKTIRNEIHNSVLKEAFETRMKPLKVEEERLAQQVYLAMLDGHGKAVQSLPSGFFVESDAINLGLFKTKKDLESNKNKISVSNLSTREDGNNRNATGKLIVFRRALYRSSLALHKTVRIPHQYHYNEYRLLGTTPLGKQVFKYLDDIKQVQDDMDNLSSMATAAVNSVSNIEKLIETYPDLKKHCPTIVVDKGQIAVRPEDLTSQIKCATKGTCKKASKKSTKPKEVISL